MKFIKNKYYHWYYQIIDKARKRGIPEGYYERHHIIPKCMEGTNDWWNIVNLTFREHFLVHWLLTKMTSGDAKRKMQQSLMAMCSPRGRGMARSRTIRSGWQYTLARQNARMSASEIKMSEETKAKIGIAVSGEKNGFFGKKHSVETCETIRRKKLGRKFSEEEKAKRRGWKHSEETKVEMSKSRSGEKHPFYGKNRSAETKEKIRSKLLGTGTGENNPFYGKEHDIETLINMRKKPTIRNKLGLRGVSKTKSGYSSRIRIDGKVEFLGYFKTSDEAVLAYKMALSKIEGAL
jgi:hypothetical protein